MPKIIHNPRKCLNPECPCESFVPKRSDMKFCDSHCKAHYHALKNKELNVSGSAMNRALRKADSRLESLYNNGSKHKIEFISEEILHLSDVAINTASRIEKVKDTGMIVYWYIKYGILGVSPGKYKIIKKTD